MSAAFAARTGPWLRRHGPRLTVLAALLVLAWMYMPVFRGEPSGDDNTFHLAESARIAECLRSGDWDFWNPSANAGYATAYYYQVIPQAVPAILAAITGGHLLFWFQLCIFVPLVLVPWFGDRGLRLLGAEPWAAACGGIAIAFCVSNNRWGHGADGQFSIGLYTQTWAFAIFPLALGHAVRWIRDRSGLAWAVATATFIGLCHPFAGIALGVALAASVMLQPAHGLLRKVRRALGNAHLPPLVLDGRGWAGELGRMVMLGALLIVLIRQSIRTLHFDANYESIIIGCAIVVAVVLDQVNARLSTRRLTKGRIAS